MRLGADAPTRNPRSASRQGLAFALAAVWAFALALAPALAPVAAVLANAPARPATAPDSPAASALANQPAPAAPAARLPGAAPLHPTNAEITAAIAKLNADPNLGRVKTSRTLRWKSVNQPPPPSDGSWLVWLGQLFAWFAGTARALLWVAGILLVGILALYIKRFLEIRGERSAPLRFSMPTHVRDLDIRPESLPDDIGAAALELWDRGEHRAALALLYRGLLSRLAHVHGVPIRDSSTEGDCLELASKLLQPTGATYAARLIRVWQRAVYGNLEPSSGDFQSLSAHFAASVDKPTAPPAVEQAA